MYRLKVTAASVYSWNLHIWDIPADEIIPGQEIAFTARFFFVWATNLTKISILLFYRRISANCRNTLFHTAVWTLIIIVALYMITVSVGMLAMCSPIGGFWNFNSSPQCMDETYFELVAAICNVVLEFTIIFLPLPTIWKLQLPKAQKWALSALFMLGIFVCMAGTVRVYYFDEVAYKTYDTTWEGYLLWVCVSLETGIALICASAPALRPLYKHYFNDTEVQEFSEARDFPEPNIFGPNPMELNQVGNSRHEETSQIFRHSGTESIIITMLPEHIDTLYRPPRSIRDLGDQSSTSSLRTWREKEPLPMV